jgi:biopolymer transport protein ExbD
MEGVCVRRPSPFTDRRDPVDIKMTPMIDVVFLLMIYFIWSSNTGTAEQLLPSTLSPPTTGAGITAPETLRPDIEFDPVVVRVVIVGGEVGWRVNDTPMPSFAELQRKLTTLAAIKRDAPIVLHPEPEVPLGHVIDVFDLSRLIGFEKIQFAVNSP